MNRSFVAVAVLVLAMPWLFACVDGSEHPFSPDRSRGIDAQSNRGGNGTSVAVPTVMVDACRDGSGEAVLSGHVTVRNAGNAPTESLAIEVRVEHKDGPGPYQDLPGAAWSLEPEDQIPAGETEAYPYDLGFTPADDVEYRLAIRVTILNHPGRFGTPWGVEPRRPLPEGPFAACDAPPVAAPQITISDPEDGASFVAGTAVTFAGTATESGGADLSDSLVWVSDLDGPLGTGPSVSAAVSVGAHTVTASVTDGNGLDASASVSVVVEPPSCELVEGITKLWRGESDAAWSNPGNWEPAGVPTGTDHVRICAAAPVDPALSAGSAVGGLFVDDAASVLLSGWTLTASGDVDAGSTGIAGPGTLVMTGSDRTVRGVVPDLRVTGTVSAAGPLTASGGLTVNGSGARFEVGGQAVTVDGDLRSQSGGLLRMVAAADRLAVAGEAVFGTSTFTGHLTGGELRVAGRFRVAVNLGFRATEDHRVVLDGATPQAVSFSASGAGSSRFQHVELVNPAGVSFETNAYLGGDLAVAGAAGPVTGAGTVTIAGDMADPSAAWDVENTTFDGSPVLPATLHTNVTFAGDAVLMGDLTLVGNLTVNGSGARLELGGHQVVVSGDLRTQGGGFLRMLDAADRLIIQGDATFTTATFVGHLTAGELRVAGQFAVPVNLGFRATQTHRVVLDGDSPQSVSFAASGPSSSRFQNLRLDNGTGVSFATNAFADGDIALAVPGGPATGGSAVTIGGDLVDPQGGRWQVANTVFTGSPSLPAALATNATFSGAAVLAGDVDLTGDLTVSGSGAQLTLAGHQVAVSGNLRTQSGGLLRMVDAADRLVVAGDAVFAASTFAGHLTAGELSVAGNFSVTANLGFRATDAHRVILYADETQNVSFASTGVSSSRFQHLDVVNAGGASLVSNVYAGGSVDVIGRLNVDASLTATVAGDLTLRAGSVLDNQGTVTYCGNLIDEGATIIGNAPAPGC